MDGGFVVAVVAAFIILLAVLFYDFGRASAGDDCEAYGKAKLRGTVYVCTKAVP